MLYAYDLDDTLADTKEAVMLAYQYAGVQPPRNFWGLTKDEWLIPSDYNCCVHARKEAVYPFLVRDMVKPLPLAEMFRATGGYIVTGASYSSAKAVIEHLGLRSCSWGLFCGLTSEGKARALNLLGETGIYFDDNERACKYLKENTKWEILRILR